MLKRKSAAARPAAKPRDVARKRVIEGQVRTNVVIDRELVEKAKAHVRTIREAVNAALAEFVKPYDYSGLLALRGTSCIAEDYDPAPVAPRNSSAGSACTSILPRRKRVEENASGSCNADQ